MKLEKKLWPYFMLGAITIVGSLLRIYNLSEKSMDVDELLSVENSANPDWTRGHLPLYFYILHFFMYLGTDEFVLRLPAAIFGVLTIVLFFEIGRLFFGTKEGLVCAWLISISTMHTFYSQIVRMYSPLAFFALLSLFFFYKASIEKNDFVDRKKVWVGYVSSTVLSLYTHYLAVFVLLVEIIFSGLMLISDMILLKEKFGKSLQKRNFLLFVSAIVAIFVLCLPIIITRFEVIERIYPSILAISDYSRVGEPQTMPESSYLASYLAEVFLWFSNDSFHVLYMFLFFFLSGIILSIRKFGKSIILLLLWVALPTVMLLLLSTMFPEFPLTKAQARYLIYVLPIYLLIVSRGIVSITEIFSKGKREN